MTNNLQVKDANNVTKEIHTIEDSTSAHYNMSIPITVSGVPIFTTAAPGVVSLADSVVGVSISPTQGNIPVSIAGVPAVTATINDNAPVSVRGGVLGAVSLGGGSAQVGRVSVFVDQVPFNVSINNNIPVHVSLAGGPTFSTPGADDLSTGLRTLYVTNFNYVYDAAGNNWDRWDGKVSIGNTVPVPVSIVGGRVSIQGAVSIAPQTLLVHVCNSQPATGGTQLVSVGGVVSTQAVQIAGTDGTNARTPLTNASGNFLVHVCNASDIALADNAPVSVRGGRVSIADSTLAVTQSGTWNVGINAGTNLVGAVSVRQIVSVQPEGGNFAVSIAGTPTVTINDNAPVSVRGGRVSIADGTLAVTQNGTWTVQPGNTPNTTPWLVSVNGISKVSVADSTLAVTQSGTWNINASVVGRVSVFVDQVPFNVSINNSLPVPVSIVGGRVSVQGISQVSVAGAVTVSPLTNTGAAVPNGAFFVGGTDGTNLRGFLTDTTGALAITSIKDDVSIAPQTLFVHVCNTAPGGASGSTQMVSVGGAVSTQAVQIAFTDGTNARTPLTNTTGNILVHVCNSLPAASGITQLVSIGGAVSTQAVQVAYTDGTNARTPLTNTQGNILVHVCNAAPGAAGGSSITTSIGGPVSVQAVPIAGVDTGGNVRQPLMTTGGALIVHVSNTAPGGSTGGGSPQVSIGGPVSVQATQIAGVDDSGNARTMLLDTTGTQKVGGFTTNPEYAFTRTTDTVSYTVGDLVANTTVAGSVIPMSFPVSRFSGGGGSFMIRRARIITPNDNRTTDRPYRIHFWNVATGLSVTNGDNGVFSPTLVSAYVGYIDVPLHLSAATGAAGVGVPGGGSEINIQLAAGQVSISALLEARASIAPTNGGIFRVGLEILQD